MAKLGDLVVRIGADTRDLNKSLGRVQRNMRSMTSNFTALGTQMTKAITLPILGVGAMAIKSAADLEKMEVSFISLTGGAKQAADMMEQLNEFTAKTPFQIEAVATSARQLIASGTKISEVNEQLQFLGDIAATTGQPINEIAAIFAKVNAKGKVELENLNQLAERGIPIFKALSDATGLLPSELGAGAVSVEQFNATLKSFNEEGGMAEGAMQKLSETASGKFSTALDNLKLAGAALAEDLLPIVNKLLDKIVDLAQRFTALSDTTKQYVLVVGALAAAVGPILLVLPQIVTALPLIAKGFTAMTGPIGLAVIGITALVTTFKAIVEANKEIPSTLDKANKAVRNQSTEVRFLVGQYKDETKSLEDRKKILERLAEIDKTHFGNLTAESTTYKDLAKNLDDYTSSLRASYLEKALAEEGSKLMSNLVKSEERIIEKRLNLQKGYDDGWNQLEINARKNALETAKKFRDQDIKALEDFEIKKIDLLKKYASITATITEGGEGLIEVISPKQMKFLEALPVKLIAVQEPIKQLQESTSILGESITNLSDKTIVLAEAFGQAFGEMMGGAKSGGKAFKSFVVDAIRGIIAIAKANIVASAMSPANPANAVSAGLTAPAFALAGLTALDALLANIPSLAEGGIAFGPSLVEVGEYSGAGGNPEVIAPLNKLKDMIGGNAIQVYGRISGDDIVISNNRATRDRNRF